MSIANTRANIKPGSMATAKARLSGSTEFVNIPYLRDGQANVKSLHTLGETGRENPHSMEFAASFKSRATKTVANHIELIDSLAGLDVDWQITARDTGVHFDSSLLTPGFFGCRMRFVAEGGYESDRYIEYILDRYLLKTEQPTLMGTVTASTPDTNAIDTLASLTLADIVPAAIRQIEFGEGSYSELLANIRKAKFVLETMGDRDDLGRTRSTLAKISLEAECLQASITEAALLDDYSDDDMDWRVTFCDGLVATMDSKIGYGHDFNLIADPEKDNFIKFFASGTILLSDIDGIFA